MTASLNANLSVTQSPNHSVTRLLTHSHFSRLQVSSLTGEASHAGYVCQVSLARHTGHVPTPGNESHAGHGSQ